MTPAEVRSSNQSSICKFAAKHTEDDDAIVNSPYNGKYQHCLTNEEFVSEHKLREKSRAVTPCEVAESSDFSTIEHWVDLRVKAGDPNLA